MVSGRICCDAAHPCSEAPRRIELGVPPVCAPECFDDDVIGRTRVSDDSHHSSVDLALELPEQRMERLMIAPRELTKDIGAWLIGHGL